MTKFLSHPNRLADVFQKQTQQPLLTIYYTAAFPNLHDTLPILQYLQEGGADIVEIGMPFSDPIADGQTIQQSSTIALQNGMSIALLFEQLAEMRTQIHIPVVLMGYLNPVLQFGIEKFLAKAQEVGIDALILPDLPLAVYQRDYQALFQRYQMPLVFLISPQTQTERIRQIDDLSQAFIYVLSDSATTGKQKQGFSDAQLQYFQRIKDLNLRNPLQIGFGISSPQDYIAVAPYTQGAIIGSAFVRLLAKNAETKSELRQDICHFCQEYKQAHKLIGETATTQAPITNS
jgi:tryptophan synthase alpha chain